MKKFLKIFIFLAVFFLFDLKVNASSLSVSASSTTITSDGRVTFSIRITGATGWQLNSQASGSVTSDCKLGDERIQYSETGENINKTLSVTCKPTSIGQISFKVSGKITSSDNPSGEYKEDRVVVTVTTPREKDSNNYLKSIGVKDYKISPEFNKDTLEYSVEVPSTVDKVTIEGEAESGYANVAGLGEVEVNEGANAFDIIVTSETGVERTYKLTVNVKDNNPISVPIEDGKYTIVKNAKNLKKPESYEEKTIKINNMDIPAFYSEITGFTLVGMKDENGKIFLAIYLSESNEYKLYNENKTQSMVLYIMDPLEDLKGYTKTNLELDGITYSAFQAKSDSSFYIVYGMNVETGEKGYYVYHKKSGTFQEYNDEMISTLEEKNKTYEYIILGLGIATIFFFFLSIFAFAHKSKKKKKVDLDPEVSDEELVPEVPSASVENLEEEKDNSKIEKEEKESKIIPEKLYVKDAVQKMNDVEKLIEEYEKTVSLSKKELEEAKQKIEDNDDEMEDFFADEKKKHSKNKKKRKSE